LIALEPKMVGYALTRSLPTDLVSVEAKMGSYTIRSLGNRSAAEE
jgi:hypothetical protein